MPLLSSLLMFAFIWQNNAVADSAIESQPELLGGTGMAASQCRGADERSKEIDSRVDVVIGVDARGLPGSVVIPDETEEALAQLARCTALKLRFKPAVRDGKDISGSIRMQLIFPIPPRIKTPDRRQVAKCFYRSVPDLRAATRFLVSLNIAADGSLASHSVSADAEPWMADVAECVLSRTTFLPARLEGKPTEAQAYLPIAFRPSGFEGDLKEMVPPQSIATELEIIEAYRACYPAGLVAEIRIDYRITVSTLGRVLETVLVKSSGDARLDEAGSCILRKLRFEPASLQGELVQATINWPIPVRPPPAGG